MKAFGLSAQPKSAAPDDVQTATRHKDAGKDSEVLSIAQASLASGRAPMDWLVFALGCRGRSDGRLAENLLRLLVDCDFAPAHYELAFLHRLKGEHRDAAQLLARSLPLTDQQFRLRMFLAHMRYAQGACPEGDEVLSGVKAETSADQRALDAMLAFGHYIKTWPLGRALALLDQVKTENHWIEADALAAEIGSAVAARRPFAFVRFGDGEGGVLRLDARDEQAHRALYDQNRQELIAMWFGESFDWRNNGFINLAATLAEATQDCDVLGIPYESWVSHEYKISSLRGIPSLVNVYRSLLASTARGRRKICSQVSHVDLANKGHLSEILKAAGGVSVISCLDGLPNLLKTKLGLSDVKLHRIPGEQGSRHVLGAAATSGSHYPVQFHQLQAELARPHAGRVFLISAGLLGKLYAATVRRHGGIAIDIGSIVDNWLGHVTRPGYEQSIRI